MAALYYRVKQSVQAMDICRRTVKSLFDVNQNGNALVSNFVPPTTSSLTVSFNNQINALHTQVKHIYININLQAIYNDS